MPRVANRAREAGEGPLDFARQVAAEPREVAEHELARGVFGEIRERYVLGEPNRRFVRQELGDRNRAEQVQAGVGFAVARAAARRGVQHGTDALDQGEQILAAAATVLFLDPSLADAHNEGTLRPLRVVAPEGLVVNARYPSTVGASPVNVGNQILESVRLALSQAANAAGFFYRRFAGSSKDRNWRRGGDSNPR